MSNATTDFIKPPSTLLTTVTDPTTNKPSYAFPLQTAAWLKMQLIVKTALDFPLTNADFTNSYGSFTDEAAVEEALAILSTLQKTATQYGDPGTLISQLAQFQQSSGPPDSIYGNAVWLAAQTVAAAQQIGELLQLGLKEIGQINDPATRIKDLTALLTGPGSITFFARQLQQEIKTFQTKLAAFYKTLDAEVNGKTNSLQSYLSKSGNILADANAAVTTDDEEIETLKSSIHKLNAEYIGFTVAASVAPLFLMIPPPFGIALAIADAATFATMAILVKKQLDAAQHQLDGVEDDEKKKTQLVFQLGSFNKATETVKDDGDDFLDQIGKMAAGWGEFQTQIDLRLNSLTVEDVKDWQAFMDQIGFQAAVDGWTLIGSKAETFYQAGFVTFTTSSSGQAS